MAMTGAELLKALQNLSAEQLQLKVISSDDPGDGFNFSVGNVEVGNVWDESEESGPNIVLLPVWETLG